MTVAIPDATTEKPRDGADQRRLGEANADDPFIVPIGGGDVAPGLGADPHVAQEVQDRELKRTVAPAPSVRASAAEKAVAPLLILSGIAVVWAMIYFFA